MTQDKYSKDIHRWPPRRKGGRRGGGGRRVLVVIASIAIACLSACTVGPRYKVPAAPVPPAFKEQPPANFKEAGEWKPADPQDGVALGNWWEVFGDAQLNELETQVNASNQNIAAAEAQFRAARSAIRASRSDLFPTVTGSATVTTARQAASRSPAGAGISAGSATGTFYTLPLDLSYEADVWGRIRGGVENATATAQAAAADVETARLSMHAELALDYFELRDLDEQQRLFAATVAGFEQALELTTNRYNQGVVSEVDVAQARTQLETAQAQAMDLGVQRAEFEHAIAILMGRPPADLSIAPAQISGEPPVIPPGLPSELLERRPDVAAAERRAAAANAEIGVAKAAFFPTISLSASGGLGSSKIASLLSWPSRFWAIGPAFAQTLFDAGKRRAIVAETQAAYDFTAAGYREAVLTAFQDVEDNLAALRILADEARQQDIANDSAQQSLDLTLNRYRGGIAIYTEVITAQNALLANQRTAIDIRTRRMTASVLLVKALGGGWNTSNLPSPRTLVQAQH